MTLGSSDPSCIHGISFTLSCVHCMRFVPGKEYPSANREYWRDAYESEHAARLEAEARVRELEEAIRGGLSIGYSDVYRRALLREALETGGEG